MSWLSSIFKQGRERAGKLLNEVQEKFSVFLNILDINNQILKQIADLEEKSQGEYLFDVNYIHSSLKNIYTNISDLIDKLIFIGGEEYLPLKERFKEISDEINFIVSGNKVIPKDDFTVSIERLNKERAHSVGSKIAQLGELKSRLGLNVPDGFAITAWAYKHFIDANNLQDKIDKSIHTIDIKNYETLVNTSEQIQQMIKSSKVPDDLSLAIKKSFSELKSRSKANGFAIRSSALGEDTLFSFAGQYATFLNVHEDEIIDKYKAVIASKFTPKAIYYFLSHSLYESELAMGVGCLEMIHSAISGVIYTLDPVNPEERCMLISATYGLGKYLVDGVITPDVFKISKDDGSIKQMNIASKTVKLVIDEKGGTKEELVPASIQNTSCLDEETIKLLVDIGSNIEKHYGCPQDIEWAIDHNKRLFIMQTRPLGIIKATKETILDIANLKVISKGGTTVCPGAGSGVVYHAQTPRDLVSVPNGAVLITRIPFPGIIMVMNKVNAIVTEHGSTASHMATIAREYRIPTLAGVKDIASIPDGIEVTVDATEAVIYEGRQEALIKARQVLHETTDQLAIFGLMRNILTKISPLNLVDSTASNFTPANCKTLHDITRFIHQKAMEEMFKSCSNIGCKEDIGLRLKTDIPMSINIIYVDKDMSEYAKNRWIEEEQIDSIPMLAFWEGVKKEGWPSTPNVNLEGLISVMSTQILRTQQNDFLERSFAILGKEYMLLGLHMGYHFSTVEAMCTKDVNKNYIRIQYKDGGATLDRRIRRIRILADILSAMGFSNFTEADFLDAYLHYQSCSSIKISLQNIGRLSIMSKQLDMALANDSIANWYKNDFLKRLDLKQEV